MECKAMLFSISHFFTNLKSASRVVHPFKDKQLHTKHSNYSNVNIDFYLNIFLTENLHQSETEHEIPIQQFFKMCAEIRAKKKRKIDATQTWNKQRIRLSYSDSNSSQYSYPHQCHM